MAEQARGHESTVLELRDDFYRDSISKAVTIMFGMVVAVLLLIALGAYQYLKKPTPVTFMVGEEWRVQQEVPIESPYVSSADLQQWVSEVLPKVFVYDFYNYNNELKAALPYFTADGWQVFLGQLNIYVQYADVMQGKMFINATLQGVPVILNEGLLSDRYAWWLQVPININYVSNTRAFYSLPLTLQILVVRVPTLNNLSGISIDNVIVVKGSENLLQNAK